MKKPIVINLIGAPGAGKSTGAAYIFSELKQKGVNCEYISEFAKDKTWENNSVALSYQPYVFGKQSYKMHRCREDVDVIITDSPLPLSIIYNKETGIQESLKSLVMDVFNTYRNLNFFVTRVKPYNPKGRNQTAEESDKLAPKIASLYDDLNINYSVIRGQKEDYQDVADYVWGILQGADI